MQRERVSDFFALPLSRWPARFVLAGWMIFVSVCVTISLSSLRIDFNDRQADSLSDVDLYWAEVERMRAGEGYYRAASQELPARNYPTSSVFNWRTPLPMWLLARLPDPLIGKFVLAAAAVVLVISGTLLLRRSGSFFQAAAGGIFLGGAILPCLLDDFYVMPILWSAVLIGLSICAYGWGRPYLAVVAGIFAAFLRELAAAYCVLMLLVALRKRQWGEFRAWCASLAVYSLFFAVHLANVGHMPRGDNPLTSHWVQFHGLAFLVACAHMNGILMPMPQWVAALYLGFSLMGLANWNHDWARRAALTTAGYSVAFLVVGQEVNQYWGTLIAPLLCLGAARAPASLRKLWCRAWPGSGSPVANRSVPEEVT